MPRCIYTTRSDRDRGFTSWALGSPALRTRCRKDLRPRLLMFSFDRAQFPPPHSSATVGSLVWCMQACAAPTTSSPRFWRCPPTNFLPPSFQRNGANCRKRVAASSQCCRRTWPKVGVANISVLTHTRGHLGNWVANANLAPTAREKDQAIVGDIAFGSCTDPQQPPKSGMAVRGEGDPQRRSHHGLARTVPKNSAARRVWLVRMNRNIARCMAASSQMGPASATPARFYLPRSYFKSMNPQREGALFARPLASTGVACTGDMSVSSWVTSSGRGRAPGRDCRSGALKQKMGPMLKQEPCFKKSFHFKKKVRSKLASKARPNLPHCGLPKLPKQTPQYTTETNHETCSPRPHDKLFSSR